MSARARGDRGAIAASVAVMPIVFTLFFTVIQVSFWYHGRSVATATAHHALEAARSYNATAEDGRTAADEFVGIAGGIKEVQVDVERGAEEVVVTVDAEPVSVVPGLQKHIQVVLRGPVERIVE